jgi:YMGG-like Gly-zipper
MRAVVAVAAAGLVAFSVAGCTPREATGTAIGTAIGAGTGALVAGNAWTGAAVGGLVGAGAGYLITKNTYRCWRTNMFGHRYRGWCAR